MARSERFRQGITTASAVAFAIVVVLQCGAAAQAPATPATPAKDTLGRDTPRGTLLGFMNAARRGNYSAALLYLNAGKSETADSDLARQLFVVLDTRLPARLNVLSDRPEGSLTNQLKPDQDTIGTVDLPDGPLEIVVERVSRSGAAPVWLFARVTLDAVPGAFEQINLVPVDRYLPEFLTRPRLGGIRLYGWLAVLLVIPVLHWLFGLVGRLLRRVIVTLRPRYAWLDWVSLSPGPIRLLVLAIAIRWIVSFLELPFLERRMWTGVERTLAVVAFTWLLLLINSAAEKYVRRHLDPSSVGGMTAMLRLARRAADVLVVAAAVLVMLRVVGLDPTAALAGIGIGGIAVALAAQKTLENVVGGVSIVFDKAIRVGDSVKVGETIGTVDYVGLRSTRIRTLDRTIVSVPNGQIAAANIETLSARDKFRFYHVVGLGYGITSTQMRAVLEGIRTVLAEHRNVDQETVRARFVRLGASSLDVEVSAYINASGWDAFLEIQQGLLLRLLEIVEQCGAVVAFPSQTLYLAEKSAAAGASVADGAAAARVVPTS